MSLPRLSIGRPVGVAMFFLAVTILGVISFARLPIDLLPEIAYPKLVIYTRYPDVAPAEVERLVTQRVEAQVSTTPGAERVESVSREGVSLVTIRFAWGTDMDFAALGVRERLDQIRDALPELADRPVVLRTDPSAEPVMALSVSGSGDLWGLKDLSETVFRRRLEQIDGIAQAGVTGGLEREIQVEVDPEKLEAYGVTIEDVSNALRSANVSRPGGTIRMGRYRYSLRTLGEFQAVQEIASVSVRRSGQGGGQEGAMAASAGDLRIRDLAVVRDGFKERESIARYNGREAVGLLLFKEAGANTVRVTEEVETVLEQLRAEYPDLSIDVAMAQAGFISDAISNVVQALVLGGILAFLVLFLFLRDARYPVAIALSIPISVVGAFTLLDAFGISLNIMSLGGLALGVGMLVDNSIVVLENIFRHREERLEAGPDADLQSAAVGAEEVTAAITASTLTTIAVFGPIIYVQGVAGELFAPLSIAVAASLLASLLVAITLLPALAARWTGHIDPAAGWLRRKLTRAGSGVGRRIGWLFRPLLDAFDRGFARFAARYHGLLESALERRGRVVAVTLALFLGTLALVPVMDRSVLPDVEQGSFSVRLELGRGTPLERTAEVAEEIEQTLLRDPDVTAVMSRVGRQTALASVQEEESGLHTAELEVQLVDGASTPEVIERVRRQLGSVRQGAVAFETGDATALGRLLGSPSGADLAVRIRGEDLEGMLAYAAQLESRLQRTPRLSNVRLGVELGQPEVRLGIDRDRVASYGLQASAVTTTVEAFMRGQEATQFLDFDRKVPVVVRLPEEARRDPRTLEVLRVSNVPLRELVSSRTAVGPVEIRRLDQSQLIPIYADARGSLDGAIAAIEAAAAEVPAPRGMRVEVGGENEEMRRAFRDLAFAFGLALILVYMILAAQFESFIHPFTILLSVPLALVGSVVALFVTGAGLNTMSLIGIVILVGIVVNDAIVKVDFINQARQRGAGVRDAILEAGRARLRPIVMTTVTTVLGLTPMALGIGRGADLRAPLAIAVIGGLVVATLLTLLVVPVAYALVEDVRAALLVRFGRATSAEEVAAPGAVPVAMAAAPAGGGGEERL